MGKTVEELKKVKKESEQKYMCAVCGGPVPCEGCEKHYIDPGTRRKDGSLDVVLPINEDGEERVAQMMKERGYDPEEWEIKSITVNEWEAQRPYDLGLRLLRQTKAHLTRIIPMEDTAWGRFALQVQDAIGAIERPPRRELKPKKGRPALTVLIGDDQAPWVNWKAHEAVCEALSDMEVDRLIYMGDGFDFDQISRYDIEHPEWESTVNETLKTGHRVLAERLEAAEWPESHFIEGNHEHRLQKYLLQKAKPLFGVKAAHLPEDAPSVLSMRYLGGIDALGMEYAVSPQGAYPHPIVPITDDYLATHGWIARKGAGRSALASVERLNSSIAVGHTHRLAVDHLTRWTMEGTPEIYTTVETGTMADLRGLGYTNHPDWQNGFVTVQTWSDGSHITEIARFVEDTLYWRDRRWEITATGVRKG